MNNLWQFSGASQQGFLSTSLGNTIKVKSCFVPSEKVGAGIPAEKGPGLLCRARTSFLFGQCYPARVSDKGQFHTTARLLVNSVTSTESSNYNLKLKATCVQLFCGSGQSLLQVPLVRRYSPDEITSINSNTEIQCVHPFYFNFSSSK